MIVIIEALPGTGKTWLCNKIRNLANVVCYDLDDVYIEADKKSRKTGRNIHDIANETLQHLIDRFSGEFILVFVGVEFDLKGIELTRYFMRISDMKKTYRGFILREVHKVADNSKKLERIVRRNDVRYIVDDIDNAIEYFVGFWRFEEYEKRYHEMLRQAEEKGSKVRTQEQIWRDIQKLSAESK